MSHSLTLRSRRRAGLVGGVALVALAGGGSGPVSSPARPSAVAPAVTSQPAEGSAAPSGASNTPSAVVPRPVHTVVVVMENHSYAQIIGNPAAPFTNQLAPSGALFTRSYAVTHPSQPNLWGARSLHTL